LDLPGTHLIGNFDYVKKQGHHLDLCLIRNQWLLRDPGAECLLSETNEDRTYGDFKEMGKRLASEVLSFLKNKLDKYSRHGGCKELKLSFVGHSIGNIIIRSALSGIFNLTFFPTNPCTCD
jgi:hypothetical protein